MLIRRLAGVLVAVALGLGAAVVFATPAAADPCPAGYWCVRDGTIVRAGGTGSGSGGVPTCIWHDMVIPCQHEYYGWYVDVCEGNSRGYATSAPFLANEPPPPGADPNGAWYLFTCVQYLPPPDATELGVSYTLNIWYEATHSPENAVHNALAMVRMDAPDIGMAPDPSGAGLVGLPVWMWTEDTDNTWGTRTAFGSDGPITVQIWVEALRIEWDMGDGAVRTCVHPGTPYRPEYGNAQSPTCGHLRYDRPSRDLPGGVYQVTATTTWQIDWQTTTGGLQGSLFEERQSSTTVLINELQVLIS